jgi:phospholipase/carboxylesterase
MRDMPQTFDQPSDELSLVHLTRPPEALPPPGARAPLLALLHGVGSNERDLFRLAPRLDARFVILSLRAPLVRGPESFAWFIAEHTPRGTVIAPEQIMASRDRIARFLGEAVDAYAADPARVYLLGFSQGAIMALTLALTQPEYTAGIAPIAGRIPPEVLPELAPVERTAGLPVLLQHGTADMVLAIDWARTARTILERQRVELTYREYEAGHQITPGMLDAAARWLSARLDGPAWESSPPGPLSPRGEGEPER